MNKRLAGWSSAVALLCLVLSCGRASLQQHGTSSLPSTQPPATTPPAGRFVYVANSDYGVGTAVFVCTIDTATDLIGSCIDAGGGSAIAGIGVQGITLSKDSSKAYLTNGIGNPDIYQCPINNSDGTFGVCILSTVTVTNAAGTYNGNGYGMLTLNPLNTIAYLEDNSNNDRIDACPVTGGVIDTSSCVTSGLPNSGSQSGEGIIINKAADTIYLADYSVGIYVCSVNGLTISSCVLKTGGGAITFVANADIALNPAEDILYVTSYNVNVVYACTTTPNGTALFDNCVIATSSIPSASGIVINAKNTAAYVTDFNHNVYTCPIASDGTFGSCVSLAGFNTTVGVAIGY